MYIRVNERDNVGIIVEPEGFRSERERIPQSHKIALQISETASRCSATGRPSGSPIARSPRGSWVREEMLDMPAAPPLDALPLATAVPPTTAGAGRPTRSRATAMPMAASAPGTSWGSRPPCSAWRPRWSTRCGGFGRRLLPRFPNVDGVVAVTHSYGCGVAIDAPGRRRADTHAEAHRAARQHLAEQPLVVSLGCEKLQPARLFGGDLPILGEANVIRLQDERGFRGRASRPFCARRKSGWRNSTGGSARRSPARNSWSDCNAAAATRFPA